MDTTIRAEALTTFDVSPDGSTVRLNVRAQQGGQGSLELPTICLNQLLMTLPRIIQQALRRSRGNASLRLVHAMKHYDLQLGEVDCNGVRRYILTLGTDGGFEVSFAATGSEFGAVAQAVIDHALNESAVLEPVTLDS